MSFKWFDLLVLFGILQGIVCSILLIRQKPDELNKKILIFIILVLGVLSFKIEIHTLNLWNNSVFRYFPLGIDLLIQPLLYYYVLSLTKPEFKLKGKVLFHLFLPAVFLFHSILVYIAVLPYSNLSLKDLHAEELKYNFIKTIEDIISVLSAIIYGYLCLISVNTYQQWLNKNISDTRYPTLNWLRKLLTVTAILGAGLFLNVLIDHTFHQLLSFNRWQIFYLYLTFLIYYLGMRGLILKTEIIPVEKTYIPEPQEKQLKYENRELESARPLILQAMEIDRLYLDHELTLQKLSNLIGLPSGLTSATINKLFAKSFRTMVNEYRVAEVKIRLFDARYTYLSILGIALECGFNSEASFYRIFKSEAGCSPKEYITSKNIQ